MYALNFYSPVVADQLRTGRKSATIRLGDKAGKYKKGMVVQVLCGNRYSPRERIFDAVIDKVEVKTLGELSPREIEHDNPEIRRTDEMAHFLATLYNREVTSDDIVTVIRFSPDPDGARRAVVPRRRLLALLRAADLRAEELVRAQRRAALLAVDGGDRRERRVARLAAAQQLAAALPRTSSGISASYCSNQRRPAPHVDADGDPVAEHLAALLAQPVRRLAHADVASGA